ncbi:inositol monophosphatase family protein [Corynebacterium caspium]|uniref:inositol monophosphatase family protein n=1 Tax=Corynebacterium caspium TaxID=234828 RepID=UPI000370C785|nr:inositol monophosphatase family protein [Corynebacterium caspium]WKD58937.1 Inositol-1-monophosphatase [Corynebacterium caspium DSM 44850]
MTDHNDTPAEPTIAELIPAITKTFVIAHAEDSDEHLAQALVYNAARMAWRLRESGVTTAQKTNISDVVTEADHAAEKFIAGVLEMLRPQDGILGEEGAAKNSQSGRTWVIDPIDGTFNFSTNSDYWCSALALVEGDPENPSRLLFGAIHRPAMGYTWFGGPEIPTVRDGKPVGSLPDTLPLSDVALGTYLHPSWLAQKSVRQAWLEVVTRCATLRMLGAGSVDLASLTDGVLGAWLQHSVPVWDWLPGRALVEGAGGHAVQVEAGGVQWSIAGPRDTVAEIVAALQLQG